MLPVGCLTPVAIMLYIRTQVVILWRREKLKVSFDYLENGWFSSGDELQQCQQQLFHAIDSRLHSADMLPFVVQLPQEFIDEHAKVSYCRHLDYIIRLHRSRCVALKLQTGSHVVS